MELDVNSNLDALQQALTEVPGLELAVLIGSRATGKTTSDSDWDIAIQWGRDTDFLTQLADTEVLRRALAHLLGLTGFSPRTIGALATAKGNPVSLTAIGLISPEYQVA